MDILNHNKSVWNQRVAEGNRWTLPFDHERIEGARSGKFEILLTPQKPVPMEWFPSLVGANVLGLASAGGQQCPMLAAAGAKVSVIDNSPAQLAQDRFVAEREHLDITTIEGDMADLAMFESNSFDLLFNPVSNVFAPDVRKIWKECARVLKKGGTLLAGFTNPVMYTLDVELEAKGILQMKYSLPYSDLTSLTSDELARRIDTGEALEFGHTFEDQIGGQIDAGFALLGLYEDNGRPGVYPLGNIMNCFMATRAIKL
jgi:SAM-dependent methyltransferase